MMGANPGHTRSIQGDYGSGMTAAWRITAFGLGAPDGPVFVHPRVLAGGVLLVEIDAPEEVGLVAVDAANGRPLWHYSFPEPELFPDLSLEPATDGARVALFVGAAASGPGPLRWNLSWLNLRTGAPVWQVGPMLLSEATNGAPDLHVFFRPVTLSGAQALVAPDPFGRPPLLAFDLKSGAIQWRSDSVGGNPVTVAPVGSGLSALGVDYVAGHPVLKSVGLANGAFQSAVVIPPAGSDANWTEGEWDERVLWAASDRRPDRDLVCISAERLRTHSAWPAACWVAPLHANAALPGWTRMGSASLSSPVAQGLTFVRERVVRGAKRAAYVAGLDVRTGHTQWTAAFDGDPLIVAGGELLVRSDGHLVGMDVPTGKTIWTTPAAGLQEVIAGDGAIVAVLAPAPDSRRTSISLYEQPGSRTPTRP